MRHALRVLLIVPLLLCAVGGNLKLSERIYQSIAPPKRTGLSPAFSLQLLAGAHIEAGEYSRAEELEHTLFNIRASVYGLRSAPIAELFASMGDER